MRERFRHETVGNIFPMVRIFPASAHGGHHPDPSPNLTRSPNPKPNPNPNQRPTCLVCQLVVVLGKALFGVRALEKFAIHGRFFTAAPHLGYNDRMRSRGASMYEYDLRRRFRCYNQRHATLSHTSSTHLPILSYWLLGRITSLVAT